MALTTLNTLTILTTHNTHYTNYPHYTHYTHHSLYPPLTTLTTHHNPPHSHLFSFFSRSSVSRFLFHFTSQISDLALHSSSTVGPDTRSERQGEREQQGQGKHRGLVLELSCVNVITSQSTLQAYIMMTYTCCLYLSCRTPRRIAIKGDGYNFDT